MLVLNCNSILFNKLLIEQEKQDSFPIHKNRGASHALSEKTPQYDYLICYHLNSGRSSHPSDYNISKFLYPVFCMVKE